MPEPKIITSAQNPFIKEVAALLHKSRTRKKTGRFVIEGQRELQLALKGGYEIEALLVCPEIASEELAIEQSNYPIVQVSKSIYEKLAYRGSTQGVMAIAKAKEHTLGQIRFKNKNPLILVAESPEKPGNLGALLRTADAAAIDAVLVANLQSDLYNPNVIRSSVGCLFTTQVGIGTSGEIIAFLKDRHIKIYCAALTASKNYVEMDFRGSSAIVVGTESTGLTEAWLNNSDQNLIIPMQGEIDSMNVSVSAAILIFEAKRQRGF
ncbi:TrmH family RNA methyltransferase [Flagellimonas lutaonensis]|uniref:tRNA/rRNA methyltransferase (SpoU) n=1 Tax=Flagellimonas lutaonensis TaxID=516051 RepID=A0A0D5YQ29_9FLAO|nr:RNA methyltransferase [Allomuricauda lutaonensis]AKA33961.1 tRNA/rRNA methyltransferase (SpoU) [Allomuricauda lutaonensis]